MRVKNNKKSCNEKFLFFANGNGINLKLIQLVELKYKIVQCLA